jgi:2-polyprenyl-3-methyl-5-hydroxy-6-metoxy-1,4-benzoquinol methylase
MRLINRIPASKLIEAWDKALKLDVKYLFEANNAEYIDYLEDEKTGLRYFSPSVVGDSYFYEQLSKYPWYYSVKKSEYDYIKTFTENKEILEVGCGNGSFYDFCSASKYIGLEINEQAIEYLVSRGIKAYQETLHEHAQQYQETYDVVCSFQVLEHLADPGHYFRDVYKLLKEDGLAIVSVPAEDSFIRFEFWDIMNMPPHHVNRFTDKSLEVIGSSYKLFLEKLIHIPIERYHYTPYVKAFIFDRLRRKFGLPEPDLLDDKWFIWTFWKIAGLLTRFIDTDFDDCNYLLPNGPYVLAVYRKRL